jgi:AcrR family transcriptional regulator
MTTIPSVGDFYQQRHQETDAKILSSAKNLLLEKGFGGVTMDEVAKNAGISRQRLYCYYHNLDEIAYRIQTGDMKLFIAYVKDSLASTKGADPKIRIERFLRSLFAYERQQSEDFLFTSDFDTYYRHNHVDEALRKEYAKTYDDLSFVAAMVSFFEEGQKMGEFRQDIIPSLATSFWANTFQLLLERIAIFTHNGENMMKRNCRS